MNKLFKRYRGPQLPLSSKNASNHSAQNPSQGSQRFQERGSSKHNAASSSQEMLVNEMIHAPTVMIIDENGKTLGIFSIDQALMLARQSNLDLVKVGDGPHGPVCKILDYGKLIYAMRKKASHAKKNQKLTKVKEIKMRPGIADGDYEHRLEQIKGFLNAKDKVKVTLRFRGRENAHPEVGMELMHKIIKNLENYARVETLPKLEGSQIFMLLGPTKH